MELRQLQQFMAVAEEKHFRRAAKRLNMSQPPLSQAIQRLEKEIGAQLFHRTNRAVELTVPGQVFFEEVRQVLSHMESAVITTRQTAQGMIGRLRVSFTVPPIYDLVPRILQEFRDQQPDVVLLLREMSSAEQVRALSESRVDVGFLRRPATFEDKEIQFESILKDRMLAILPENHRLAKSKKISLRDLRDEPFIITPPVLDSGFLGLNFYVQIMNLCQRAGFTPRIVQEAVRLQTIAGLVETGMGVALIPGWVQHTSQTGVVYKELQDRSPLIRLDVGMAWSKENPSPILSKFINLSKDVSKKWSKHTPST